MSLGVPEGDGVIAGIIARGLIAGLRLEQADDLLPVAEAIGAGGVAAIEVALTPASIQILPQAQRKLARGIFLGAGSILTPEAAREAIRAGTAFVATPTLNPDVIRVCREARVPIIPGAFTPTEIYQARDLGASLITVYPAGPLGADYIKSILAVIPEVRLVAAGGTSLENVGDFIRAGAAAVGVGDGILSKDLLARRDFAEITRRARAAVEAVQHARGHVARPVQPIRPVEGPDVR